MFHETKKKTPLIGSFAILVSFAILLCAGVAGAQEAGGDLSGGAGIFRPKNPEAKRTGNSSRPRPTRLTAAEIEEKYGDAVADGNDARDARKFAAAEGFYRAAVKLKPRDARAHYGLGNVFVDQQRWDDAEKSYHQAVDFAPTNGDALTALSFVLVQPSTGASNAKRFSDAEAYARRATQLQSTNAVAFDRLGVAMTARGIFTSDTEAAFRRAVELDSNFVVAQVHLAHVLRRLNRAAEAEPLYQAAIQKASDAPTLVLIADAMQSETRWNDSDSILRRALQMDPRNPGALFLLGRLMSVSRRYEEAVDALKLAVEVSPKNFPAHNILARCYLGLNRFDDAFRVYDQAAALASDADRKQLAGAFGFGGVGDGYMSAGRSRDALRAYERGLQLDPANAELPNKISAARAKIQS